MANNDLLKHFACYPETVRHANNLSCSAGTLYSYAEPIARYKDGVFTVSRMKWSLTTTRHQNTLLGILARRGNTYSITEERPI